MEELRRHHPDAIRLRVPPPIGGPGLGNDGDSDTPEPQGTVQVTWGALVDELDIVGMTVGEVQALLEGAYNISPGVGVNVNGAEAGADTVLATGDSLEFVRAAGEKGAS